MGELQFGMTHATTKEEVIDIEPGFQSYQFPPLKLGGVAMSHLNNAP
jgi:hypothetical protein